MQKKKNFSAFYHEKEYTEKPENLDGYCYSPGFVLPDEMNWRAFALVAETIVHHFGCFAFADFHQKFKPLVLVQGTVLFKGTIRMFHIVHAAVQKSCEIQPFIFCHWYSFLVRLNIRTTKFRRGRNKCIKF
jgi:hypothetical protein